MNLEILEKNSSELPKGWKIVSIGEHFRFKNGLNKAKKFFGQGTPIVNYMDVYPNPALCSKDIKGKVSLTPKEIRALEVRRGDVLFTRTSETIDEIGLTTTIMDKVEDTVFSGFLLRARPVTNFFQLDFKKYCFRSAIVRKQIISTSSQTTRALTNGRLLSQIKLPVPEDPFEQQSIAKCMSDIDKLIHSLGNLIQKKKNSKWGTIQEILTGKRRLERFSGGWIVEKLGMLSQMQSGGTPLTHQKSYYGGKIPWVIISDITKSDKYLHVTEKRITEKGLQNSSARMFKAGTLLFAMYASLGKCCIAKVDVSCNQAILGIETNKIDSEFLYYYLLFYEKDFSQKGQTGTQTNLNKKLVQDLDIFYPISICEQISISKILSEVDEEIFYLEKQLAKYINIRQGMMQKLLTGEVRLV